jgi:hypothetical protein
MSPEAVALVESAIDDIFDRIADGQTLESACAVHNLSRRQLRRYIVANPEAGVAYDRAREAQTEALFDQLQDTIANSSMDPRFQANRIKALTWIIEKRDPAKYGQRASIEHTIRTPDMAAALAIADKNQQELLARRAALALPAKVSVLSPAPETSDAAWAEIIG